jgi:hypothetical protein
MQVSEDLFLVQGALAPQQFGSPRSLLEAILERAHQLCVSTIVTMSPSRHNAQAVLAIVEKIFLVSKAL